MGTWYVDFWVDSPATAPEMARCRESNLDLIKDLPGNGARNPSSNLLSTALDFLEEERVMQQISVSISLSF